MKVLHTSDWHLGQTFYDYDRHAEQQDMLRQIVDIVRDEQPHAMVVSGDVYHTGNPSPAAVRMYNTAMLQMHRACPAMTIVVTAGNHDSATRLMVNNELWSHFSVTVLGNISRHQDQERTPDYDSHIVEVRGPEGDTVGYVAAVPHCYESNFPATNPELQREQRVQAYFQGLLDAVGQRNSAGLPVVLMAHMAVSGCDLAGHDNIGGIETRDTGILGHGYDYVALGHIHTPHDINERVRYCGTPIPVNFGEKYEHSVTVVTLGHGAKPQIRTRRITNLIPLHDFPSRPEPLSRVLELIRDYPDHQLCYLRVMVRVDQSMTPLAGTLISEAVKGKRCRICLVQPVEDEARVGDAAPRHVMTSNELRAKTPLEVAEMFYQMKGMELTDSQRELIREATIKAEREKGGDQ